MHLRLFLCALFFFVPVCVQAAAKTATFEVSGWIPYWRAEGGVSDVTPHLDSLTTVFPFGFTVDSEGVVFDAMSIHDEPWASFIAAAHAKKVRVIPTVMWANGAAMDKVFRDPTLRKAHIENIVSVVEIHNFDGIDIDYEAKMAQTKPYFSLFLKELYKAMGKKWVYCTIEPRTPPQSAFSVMPENLEYANDYTAINKYCDRVQIMAYDQGTIDLLLNSGAQNKPYVPVADPVWVEKVVRLASQTIAKRKIILGIPTYGYEYSVTPLTESGFRYDRLWAFNPRYALELAAQLGLTPTRNTAGEVSYSYIATTSPLYTSTGVAAGPGFASNIQSYNVVWWSDAIAIAAKVGLAKKLGIRGVAIFKLDGGEDQRLWSILD